MRYYTKEWYKAMMSFGNADMFEPVIDKEYSDEEAGIMGELILSSYINKGIDPDKTPSFKNIDSKKMPTFSDVKKELDSEQNPKYTATFNYDQRIEREDTSQETFASIKGTATLNNLFKITSLALTKTASY